MKLFAAQKRKLRGLGLILEIKKSHKLRLFEILVLNKALSWEKKSFLGRYGLFIYKTDSFTMFRFVLNLLNQLVCLFASEPPATTPSGKGSSLLQTSRLIWDEALPVQKKFGPRYRTPQLKRSFKENQTLTLVDERRGAAFLNATSSSRDDIQIKYVVWGENFLTAHFFLNNFWQPYFASSTVHFDLTWLLLFRFYYSIVITNILVINRICLLLKFFSVNNA